MALSLRLKDEEMVVIKSYAELKGITITEAIRQAILERIEDEYDLRAYDEALEEWENNPNGYTIDEVLEEIEGDC